ncbi:MAG: histidine kinase [Actinomycetota bacterium]|nr:histidine kinase [Actinomycetota bacterium]
MDLTPYVETMRAHLLTAAAMGDERARDTARLLADALEPGARLALTNALSAFAAEVTAAWGAGSVEIRMRSGEPEVVVTAEPAAAPSTEDAFVNVEADGEAGAARVSLRMPESVKSAAESRANEAALSLNAWLTRTIAGALSRVPPPPAPPGPPLPPGRRLTGYHRS